MTGEEWLRRTFDSALRTSDPPFRELRGALRGLSECGVLSKDLTVRACERLDDAEGERRTIIRRRTERVGPAGSHATPTHGRLEGLLTPGRTLADVDGITVVVVLVELWTSHLILRLEALRNELTDALDASYDIEWKAFEKRLTARRDDADAEDGESERQYVELALSGRT